MDENIDKKPYTIEGQIEIANDLNIAAHNLISSADNIVEFAKMLLKLEERAHDYENYRLQRHFQNLYNK